MKEKIQRKIKGLIDQYKKLDSEQLFFLYIGIVYIVFVLLDLLGILVNLSAALKYASIGACLVYVVSKKHHDSDLIFALFFTVIADTILVWTQYAT